MNRNECLILVSRRILIFSSIVLLIALIITSLTSYLFQRFALVPFLFTCGLLGGFVSIQQRLKKISTSELQLLSKSWAQIMVIPVFGGIFSLVLYILFLSNLISGNLFPSFYIPDFSEVPTKESITSFLTETYPKSGTDFAKLMFWAFIAGFSERFVPQIIHNITESGESKNDNTIDTAERGNENSEALDDSPVQKTERTP